MESHKSFVYNKFDRDLLDFGGKSNRELSLNAQHP